MDRREIEQRVRMVLVRELAVPGSKVRDDSEFRGDLGADSLDMVQLTSALEEEFGVYVTQDEAAFCQTVGTAIDIIEAKVERLQMRQAIGGRR